MAITDKQPPINVPVIDAADLGTDGRVLVPGTGTGGGGGDLNYHHTQVISASVWTITHNLGKRPSVTVFDNAIPPNEWHGDVTHVSVNQLTVSFTPTSFAGDAYLN